MGQDITADIGQTMGMKQHYFIQEGNYVGINENGTLVQLYNANTNTYYLQMGGQVKSIPGNTEFPQQLEIQESDSRINILDYECRSLILITEQGKTTYYFNSQFSVDPKKFGDHRFGNWAQYLVRSQGAIPLKFITEMSGFTQISEAEMIDEQEVDYQKFDIMKYIKED